LLLKNATECHHGAEQSARHGGPDRKKVVQTEPLSIGVGMTDIEHNGSCTQED